MAAFWANSHSFWDFSSMKNDILQDFLKKRTISELSGIYIINIDNYILYLYRYIPNIRIRKYGVAVQHWILMQKVVSSILPSSISFSIAETWRNISKIVGKLWPRGCLPKSERTENRWKIPLISKFSVTNVKTRRINLICMSKKCSVPLILEYCVILSSWRSFPSTLFTVYS